MLFGVVFVEIIFLLVVLGSGLLVTTTLNIDVPVASVLALGMVDSVTFEVTLAIWLGVTALVSF